MKHLDWIALRAIGLRLRAIGLRFARSLNVAQPLKPLHRLRRCPAFSFFRLVE